MKEKNNKLSIFTSMELVIMNSLFIIGLYEATEPGNLLASIHDFMETRFPSWLYKPILGCVYCMASFWGSLFYLIYYTYHPFVEGFVFFYWFFYIGAVSGCTYVLYGFVKKQGL